MLKTLGGERLGSGKGMKVALHGYERSTFNLSRVWRSTMNVGTLIPFFTEIGLNGDTFDIDLSAMMRTVPTQGPLFGSYKLQMDVFGTPIRLYNGLLHNNALNIGMDMSRVKLPTIELEQRMIYDAKKEAFNQRATKWADTCLSAFFNKRGLFDLANVSETTPQDEYYLREETNALPYLCYYDIFKQYYANKQEPNGKIIVGDVNIQYLFEGYSTAGASYQGYVIVYSDLSPNGRIIKLNPTAGEYDANKIYNTEKIQNLVWIMPLNPEISVKSRQKLKEYNENTKIYAIPKLLKTINIIPRDGDNTSVNLYVATGDTTAKAKALFNTEIAENEIAVIARFDIAWEPTEAQDVIDEITNLNYSFADGSTLKIEDFPLENIDEMRRNILKVTDFETAIKIDENTDLPYGANTKRIETQLGTILGEANEHEFNGILLKTYQSDIFNNWLQKEWVDNIATISAVSTTTGSFSMDSLNLAKKIYNMLNRVAVSGGTYEDWQEAIYGEEAIRRAENPIYYGGASAEIVFEEVISNSASENEPLGTIAGRGNLNGFQNGHIVIKCEEPMVIMGIVSITPRLDYDSNDNWWMRELKTLNDLHKPALDGIGFQDLLAIDATYKAKYPTFANDGVTDNSAMAIGKQPAWLHYQTAVNEVHGEFCDKNKTGWMVLTRDYKIDGDLDGDLVGDFTTYIDPKKYNYPFAYKELDAQNFWCQIGVNITARRKMSAKAMPNV